MLVAQAAAAFRVSSSPRLHATRRSGVGVMALPLDHGVGVVLDAIPQAAIERRLQAVACTIPAAVAVLATRSSSGIPQIVEMFDSKSPRQVASKWGSRVFFGDAVVYLSRLVYYVRRGYALSCWSELVPLMLQNLWCFYLTRSREVETQTDETAKLLARPWARRANKWLKLSLDAAFLSALGLLMIRLPSRLLSALCLWSVPLSITSYAVQALETYRLGPRSTTRSGWALRIRWFGSLVRVLTTARLLGGDVAAMSNHATGLLGCSVLLLQRSAYEITGPTKRQTRYALYSQLLGEERRREWRPPSRLPAVLDQTLHAWRSLGGFGAAVPPSSSDVLRDRRAFDAINEDGSGCIDAAQLKAALMQAASSTGVSSAYAEELAQQMLLAADVDGNGVIDFEEFCAVIR